MERGENFTKRDRRRYNRRRLPQFVEQGFDWIALLVITLIILFGLLVF